MGKSFPADKEQMVGNVLDKYGIDTSNVARIEYDPHLEAVATASRGRVVTLGPKAFERGEGWLASTLGHEIEVHINSQLVNGAGWYEPGSQGRYLIELEATTYEINNASRFGLSSAEVTALKATRMYYYNLLVGDNKWRALHGVYKPYPN